MAERLPDQQVKSNEPDPRPLEGVRAGTVVITLILLVLSLFWMLQAGIINQAVQLGESVPVVPAVGALMLLTVIGLALRRFSPWRLPARQVLLVYCFLCIAVTINSVGVVRLLFPNITAVYYFASPENNFTMLQKYIPGWLAPKNPTVIRDMYEASPTETVPWRAWLIPLLMWSIFLTAFYVSMAGIMTLFRRQWADKERLTFPIVEMALDISDQEGLRVLGGFFGNPTMWIGFAIAALYNVSNIANAWNPSIPAIGKTYDLGRFLTERPLSALRPLSIAWRPENIGLGYLVSTEITLSVWVFYLLLRFSNLLATTAGYEISGFPFDREQSAGAYLALGIFLIWVSRDYLKTIFQKALGGMRELDDRNEPMSYRGAFIAAFGGFAVMVLFAMQAGMWWWTAMIYFGLILLFALVYARARAEAGAAMVWLFPFYLHEQMMIYVGGSAPFTQDGNFGNLTILSTFMFASRGYFQSIMAYQLESSKIAQVARLKQRVMSWWLLAALLIGLAGAYTVHLHAYYTMGANILEGGTTEGGYRTTLARNEFTNLSSIVDNPRPPDRERTAAAAVGALVVALLVVLRTFYLRFPLHPLGFAMVTAYGGPLWGPFLLVWIIKSLILRIWGMRAYRRMIPFFLGIVLGHFFMAGLVWGMISSINEMYRRYSVYFG